VIGKTYNEQLQAIANQYRASGELWPATSLQIAAWAIRTKLWYPHHSAILRQCAEDIARAMREEYIKDPQGRSVRLKHAARVLVEGKQTVFWDDIRTAPRTHMEIAFQQRRQQIVGDCRQLKADVDSYNENAKVHPPIQMVFNFTEDLAELEALEPTAA